MITSDVLFKVFIASSDSDEYLVSFERTIASVTPNQILVFLDMHNRHPNIQLLNQSAKMVVEFGVFLRPEYNWWYICAVKHTHFILNNHVLPSHFFTLLGKR